MTEKYSPKLYWPQSMTTEMEDGRVLQKKKTKQNQADIH